MPIRTLLSLCLSLMLIPFAGSANADALERIRARGQLLVAVKNEGNPSRAAHKDPAHFDKRDFELAIARAIAAKLLGSEDRLTLVTFRKPERVPAVADGKVDLAISMLRPTPRNLARVDFSAPYYEAGVAVMQKAGGDIAETAQLAGRHIGVIARNDAGPHALLSDAAPGKLIEFDHFDAAATALDDDAIDALFSEGANIDVYVREHPGRYVCSPPLAREPVAIAVPKGEPALLAAVNAVIDELRASGRLDALQRAHGLR